MCGPEQAPNPAPPLDDAGEGAPIPCPFCGCRHHIEDAIAIDPETHSIHQCLRCGLRFDDRRAVCSRCGSPGEFLGNVIVPGRGLYVQYRCHGCGHGFMIRIADG